MIEIPGPGLLDFGAVLPGGVGPDISVDPAAPPFAFSSAGGIQVLTAPADDTVTAQIVDGNGVFAVRDLNILEFVLEDVDPGELPPGHHGPPPKIKVLEIVASVKGSAPLQVRSGQRLLARVEY